MESIESESSFQPPSLSDDSAGVPESCAPVMVDRASGPRPESSPIIRQTPARWWTPIVVIGLSLLCFIVASGVMAVVATAYVHGGLSAKILSNPENLRAVTQSPVGLFLLVVTPQFALVLPCLLAAYLSPTPTLQRLALVRGNWPIWTWPAAMLAAPLVGLISGVVVSLFMEESAALKEMSDIFRHQGQTGFTALLILMVGVTPALCEELLFRGYVQTRMTRVFPPVLGILFSSLAFAAFHMDPVHVVAVIPLGLFLGWLTWQSGSLFPAILAHFGNNAVSVLATIFSPDPDAGAISLPMLEFTIGIFLFGCVGMIAVLIVSIVYRRPSPINHGNPTFLDTHHGLKHDSFSFRFRSAQLSVAVAGVTVSVVDWF